MEKSNPRVKKLIIQVVDNQIRMNNPPETKITLNRLISKGYSKQEEKELIGSVLVLHIYTILKDETLFNEELYVKQLNNLPQSPMDEDR